MIRFACPGCSVVFSVPDEQAGKSGRCPKCQSRFVIPDAPTADLAPPPPPPPTVDPNEPIEIHPCPKCGARLSVLSADLGGEIACPSCQTAFTAQRADIPLPPETKSKSSSGKRAKLLDNEDDGDRPSKRKSRRRDNEDEDDRPSKRSGRKRKLPKGLRDSRHRTFSKHDGLLMLLLAIGGLLVNAGIPCCVIFPFIGMVMSGFIIFKSSVSISEIKQGVMDPGGRVPLEIARGLAIFNVLLGLAVVIGWYTYRASQIGNGDGN